MVGISPKQALNLGLKPVQGLAATYYGFYCILDLCVSVLTCGCNQILYLLLILIFLAE
jgi:hypothetical protein